MIKPYKDQILVQDELDETKTQSGIILSEGVNRKEKIARAKVIAISDNLVDKYSIGDVVVYPKYRKQDVSEAEFILRHGDIIGRMK